MNNKINNSRINFEKLGTIYSKADNITIKKEIIENVNCYWFNDKKNTNTNKILVYLHGGCFVLGSIQSHQSLASHLSKQLSLPVLFIDYSLAPEKPFPSAIFDIIHVYQHLLLRYPENDIILMGDSAGAGLAISVLSILNEKNIHAPKYLVMLSPWIDLTCTKESIAVNADLDPIITKEELQEYVSLYVNGANLSDANPIETMYGQFPPTLILVGSGEILLDDSKSIYNKIASQQTKAKLSVYDKQNHVWMFENIHTEASKTAMKEIQEFITDF